MIELLPCPFCGKPDPIMAPMRKQVQVFCFKCEACGPLADSEREAIEAWNAVAELVKRSENPK